jgi:2-iminoacetate synthase
MSFTSYLHNIDSEQIKDAIYNISEQDVISTLAKAHHTITDFPVLVSPAAIPFLEEMAVRAQRMTLLRFGKTMKLYAPIYISNECTNACVYCGFNVQNKIERMTLSMDEIQKEADALYRQGFRHILLVTGENKRKVSVDYLADIAAVLSKKFVAVSIEVYPMDTADYKKLVKSGVVGIAVYQETYDRSVYKTLHKGPKSDFTYRLEATERAGEAGFRELGIGALIGLTDFRVDMTCVAIHAGYLMKKFWQAQIAVSFPRLRDAVGGFQPQAPISDRQLAQVIFSLRMVLPDADLVLSTRERPDFRNGLAGIGITRMSAGSKTQPGGYSISEDALEQFEVADTRTPAEVAAMLGSKGLEPVWKDFDQSFLFDSPFV